MKTETEEKTPPLASPKKVLVECKLVAEPCSSVTRWCRDEEAKARALESWASDVVDFIRDHRSMDPLYLSVERIYQEQCSLCGNEWEPESHDSGVECACCGARCIDVFQHQD